MRKEIDPRQKYLLDNFGFETELHKKIVAKSQSEDVFGMQISAHEGQLLQLLAKLIGAKKIVEVGCLYGYSALWFLQALPEDGELYLLEQDPARVEWMKQNFKDHPGFHKIHWLVGDAVKNLASLRGPFDLCFIDANKGAYPDYLTWAEKEVRRGGLVIGDNTFLWGAVYGDGEKESRTEAMREFNRRLADPSRFLSTLIPTSEGLTVGQKL